MKKLTLAALALTTAASVFAQGTITFNIRYIGTTGPSGTAHIYGGGTGAIVGQGSNDSPSGSTSFSGLTLIGSTPSGLYGQSTTFAQLLGANGANAPEGSLTPQGSIATFRSGTSAGAVFGFTDTLQSIPLDAAAATIEMVVWDNSSGQYSTWTQASVAWLAGTIAAGKSGAFNVSSIGGSVNTPPNIPIGPGGLQSFNIYVVPEPTSFALLGLGAAAMMVIRRRK